MERIFAVQEYNFYGRSGVSTTEVVGYFPVALESEPFVPVRVALVQEGMVREPLHSCAWVAHDGQGRILGDPDEVLDLEYFRDPENYLSPEDFESYIPV